MAIPSQIWRTPRRFYSTLCASLADVKPCAAQSISPPAKKFGSAFIFIIAVRHKGCIFRLVCLYLDTRSGGATWLVSQFDVEKQMIAARSLPSLKVNKRPQQSDETRTHPRVQHGVS
jgi:hypothetical protein